MLHIRILGDIERGKFEVLKRHCGICGLGGIYYTLNTLLF